MKLLKSPFHIFLIVCAVSLIMSCFLNSCYNTKKAVKQTNKSVATYPDTVRSIFNKRWPVTIIPTTKDSTDYYRYKAERDYLLAQNEELMSRPADTVIDSYPYFDSAICMEAFDKNNQLRKDNKALRDYNNQLRNITIPVIRDTFRYEDSSKIDTWRSSFIREAEEHNKIKTQLAIAQSQIKSKNKQLWVFYGLLALIAIYFGFKVASKLKNAANPLRKA